MFRDHAILPGRGDYYSGSGPSHEMFKVTLIGAAIDRNNDQIWITTDAKEFRTDRYSGDALDEHPAEKLYEHGDSFAWGYYGDTVHGLRSEFAFTNDPINSWPDLLRWCNIGLRFINGGEAALGAVFAGFVDGEPGLRNVQPSGFVVAEDHYIFGGNGRVAAKAVWKASERLRPEMSVGDRLTVAMGAAIQVDFWLGFPLSLWRVQRTGSIVKTRLDEDELPH